MEARRLLVAAEPGIISSAGHNTYHPTNKNSSRIQQRKKIKKIKLGNLKPTAIATGNLNISCALVPGGGGGIGKAINSYLISRDEKVIILSRSESSLKEMQGYISGA